MRGRWLDIARAGLFLAVLGLGCLLFRRASRRLPGIERGVWEAIQPRAERAHLDAGFVYALVAAESDFDPHAARGNARGLMQLTPEAWAANSRIPYPGAVWEWQPSLEVGINRLAALRVELMARGVFSYPLLMEAYQHGLDYVVGRKFDLRRMPQPDGAIARRLLAGELHPVAPPR